MNRSRLSLIIAFIVLALALGTRAYAMPRSIAMPRMPAAVQANCAASMLPIQFGTVSSTSSMVPLVVTVNCPNGVPYEVRFLDPSGCRAVRNVGGVQVVLLLPGGAPWCDGTGGTETLHATGTGAPQTFYGTARVLSDMVRVRAGAYQQPLQLQVVPQTLP